MKLHLSRSSLFLLILYCFTIVQATEKILLCYYNSLASFRTGDGHITVSDIDPSLCTHMVYFHLNLDIETNILRKTTQFLNADHKEFIALKSKNPKLKVLIYLTLNPKYWKNNHVQLMANNDHIDNIVTDIVIFLKQYMFDGLILDFYPVLDEKPGFLNLIKAMKKAFSPNKFLLSVPGNLFESRLNYGGFSGSEIASLNQGIDFLILHAYDFHIPSREADRADHPSPLHSPPWDTKNENVDFQVDYWIFKGVPPEKILLGISLYGRSWALSSNETNPPAPAKGPGPPQKFTNDTGMMAYYEICLAILNEGWQVFKDPNRTMGPYAVSTGDPNGNKIWVGYDDQAMVVIKSEYILSKGLSGVAVFDVTFDDFRNKCGFGSNPMLTAIKNTLYNISLNTLTTLPTTIVTKKLVTDLVSDSEYVFFRNTFAFVSAIFVIISSCITIFYMFCRLFSSSLPHKRDYSYTIVFSLTSFEKDIIKHGKP